MGGVRVLCAVMALVVLAGCQDPYEAGLQAFERGDWKTALDRFERVDPFHMHFRDAQVMIKESIFGAGEAAFRAERFDEAIGWYRQLKEKDAHYAEARSQIGLSFYGMARQEMTAGNPEEALRLANIVRASCECYDDARELAHEAKRRIEAGEVRVASGL